MMSPHLEDVAGSAWLLQLQVEADVQNNTAGSTLNIM